MTKDYKSSSRSGGRRSGGGGGSGGVWKGMLIGLFVGVAGAVGAALFLNRHNNPFMQPALKPSEPPRVTKADDPKQTTQPETLQPGMGTKQPTPPESKRFDFYQILPGNAEPAVAPTAKPAESAPTGKEPVTPPPAGEKPGQFLQAGAFQNEADADNLKAKLAMLGVEANIQTTTIPDKGVWHRVRIGPLKSMDEVDRMRQLLTGNGIDSNLVKQKQETKTAHADGAKQ
ncbi:cell division protein FtsN [Chitinivorax tropicus]|uniref:Cell division protein FtsN n=1 Tax=Chitinivorax tropicus TaxID=714531 RepID=A0A840MNS6_9PROT|nr:SPOR domain-containing protein [Chitinivorax tropicus]MBB5020090.1 cell division protein FtsN [Chitinivorax tropicus]